jgi:hypothetical protein
MATSHPRIAVVRDPELDAAMRRVAAVIGKDLPAATLVRELALRGAETIASAPASETVRRLVVEHGARPAEGSLQDFLAEGGPADEPDRHRRASALLDELRGDRLR